MVIGSYPVKCRAFFSVIAPFEQVLCPIILMSLQYWRKQLHTPHWAKNLSISATNYQDEEHCTLTLFFSFKQLLHVVRFFLRLKANYSNKQPSLVPHWLTTKAQESGTAQDQVLWHCLLKYLTQWHACCNIRSKNISGQFDLNTSELLWTPAFNTSSSINAASSSYSSHQQQQHQQQQCKSSSIINAKCLENQSEHKSCCYMYEVSLTWGWRQIKCTISQKKVTSNRTCADNHKTSKALILYNGSLLTFNSSQS